MKRTGPPRLPTNIKLVRGTFRKDQAAKNEAMPVLALPSVPEHLSDLAKVEWGRVIEELHALGLMSNIDRAALCAYCDCWATYVEAAIKVQQMGLVVTTKQSVLADGTKVGGNIIENPFFSIKKRSLELMYRYLTEFGMSPASRASIDIEPKKPTTGESRWKSRG